MSNEDIHFRVTAHQVAEASISSEAIEKALRAEFKRGFEAGQQQRFTDEIYSFQAALRAEVLSLVRLAKQEVRPEPNAMQEVLTDTHVLAVAVHVPEEQLQQMEAEAVEVPAPEPRKNVGGAPSQIGRPENIPSNYEMATEAIRAHDGAASGTQIRDYIKKKYWPGIAAHWTATLYDMVTSRKLARAGINFVVPELSTAIAKPAVPKPAPKKVQLQPRVYAPNEKPEEFQWKDSAAVLLSPKEYLLAAKLRAAMGKGHIGVQFLAENALGLRRGQGEEAKLTLRQLASAMQERLATVGLAIEYHEGFGFLMKEVEVG